MRSVEHLAAIARRGCADAEELELVLDALGAPTKRQQRGAAEALAALARAGQPVHEVLERGLRDPSPQRRWGAAYAWSLLGPVPAACLPVLLEALGSDDGDVRWAAATIVRQLRGRPEVVAALRALAERDSALQRKMALYCLRDLDVRAADVEAELLRALDDGHPTVRLAAMSALARLADDRPAAARAVARLLDDADAGVRRAAAATLGRLGVADASVIGVLRRARDAGDPALARAAARALSALGD